MKWCVTLQSRYLRSKVAHKQLARTSLSTFLWRSLTYDSIWSCDEKAWSTVTLSIQSFIPFPFLKNHSRQSNDGILCPYCTTLREGTTARQFNWSDIFFTVVDSLSSMSKLLFAKPPLQCSFQFTMLTSIHYLLWKDCCMFVTLSRWS